MIQLKQTGNIALLLKDAVGPQPTKDVFIKQAVTDFKPAISAMRQAVEADERAENALQKALESKEVSKSERYFAEDELIEGRKKSNGFDNDLFYFLEHYPLFLNKFIASNLSTSQFRRIANPPANTLKDFVNNTAHLGKNHLAIRMQAFLRFRELLYNALKNNNFFTGEKQNDPNNRFNLVDRFLTSIGPTVSPDDLSDK